MRRPALALLVLAWTVPAPAAGLHLVLRVGIPAAEAARRDEIMAASLDVAGRRLDRLGIKSPRLKIEDDRIVADIADYSDSESLRAAMAPANPGIVFHLVDESVTEADIRVGRVPDGIDVVEQRPLRPGQHPPPLALYRVPAMSGNRIADAHEARSRYLNDPVVAFRLDRLGTDQFAKFTRDNVGKRFAIVLRGRVVSAPYIMSVIVGGAGEIDGNFSEKEASVLAALLGSGPLPAPWKIVELKPAP